MFETRTAVSVGPRMLRRIRPATEVGAPAIAGAVLPSVSMTLRPILNPIDCSDLTVGTRITLCEGLRRGALDVGGVDSYLGDLRQGGAIQRSGQDEGNCPGPEHPCPGLVPGENPVVERGLARLDRACQHWV